MVRFLCIALCAFQLVAHERARLEILIFEARRLDIQRRIENKASDDELNSRHQLWDQIRNEALVIFEYNGPNASINHILGLRIFDKDGPFLDSVAQNTQAAQQSLIDFLKAERKLFL